MCRMAAFMVDSIFHFSSDYLKYQVDFELRSLEDELQPYLSLTTSPISWEAGRGYLLLGIFVITRHNCHLHAAYIS